MTPSRSIRIRIVADTHGLFDPVIESESALVLLVLMEVRTAMETARSFW